MPHCFRHSCPKPEVTDCQEDLQDYLEKEQMNLEKIHRAFHEIEREYTIAISDAELRLVNDIVFS